MKKTFVLFLVLTFVFVLNTNLYSAVTPKKGIVNTNVLDLNLRSGPSTSYAVVASLAKGTPVEILDVKGSWYKVSANGCVGYVFSSWIQVTETEEVDYSTLPKSEQEKVGRDLGKSANAAKLATTVAE